MVLRYILKAHILHKKMIDLSKVKLPDCIELSDGKLFYVRTDFRTWLSFDKIVSNPDAVIDDVDFIYAEEIPSVEKKSEAFLQLLNFFRPESLLPRVISSQDKIKIVDYTIDADLIYSAFYEQYKIDLLSLDKNGHAIQMHWHKFLALLAGLHNTKLNEVMNYRCYEENDKTTYEESMKKLRQAWELPEQDSSKIQEDLDKFNALFD